MRRLLRHVGHVVWFQKRAAGRPVTSESPSAGRLLGAAVGAALARIHHGDYVAELVYEETTGLFRGRVFNLECGGLDFWGRSVDDLRAEFARSVGAYEQACRDGGREPERPRPVGE